MVNEARCAAATQVTTGPRQAFQPETGTPPRHQAPLRILIDACLTPGTVPHLAQLFGSAVDVRHVDQVLPLATTDAAVLSWAAAERRVVVTANRADFLRLVRGRASHPGLGLITDQDTRSRQIKSVERLISALLSHLAVGGTTINHVFTVREATGRLAARQFP